MRTLEASVADPHAEICWTVDVCFVKKTSSFLETNVWFTLPGPMPLPPLTFCRTTLSARHHRSSTCGIINFSPLLGLTPSHIITLLLPLRFCQHREKKFTNLPYFGTPATHASMNTNQRVTGNIHPDPPLFLIHSSACPILPDERHLPWVVKMIDKLLPTICISLP